MAQAKVRHLMYLEPNEIEKNNISSRLRTQGFAVETPTGGFHALHLFEKDHFHAVIVSGHMPDMSDMEIITLFRNAKHRDILPIIFVAQSEDEKEVMEAIEAGASVCIKKSDNFNVLVKSLKKYIDLTEKAAAEE